MPESVILPESLPVLSLCMSVSEVASIVAQLVSSGSADEALDLINEQITTNPRSAQLWYLKAKLFRKYFHDGRSESLKCLNQVLTINPHHVKALYMKSRILYFTDREESRACIEAAYSITTDHPGVLCQKGIFAYCDEDYNDALVYLNNALRRGGADNHEVWHYKSLALNDLGRHEEALKCCKKAISIYPFYIYAWNVQGKLLRELGRENDAQKIDDAFERKSFCDMSPRELLELNKLGRELESVAQIVERVLLRSALSGIGPISVIVVPIQRPHS